MYLHYLTLRYQLQQAEATGDNNKILAAIGEETQFGGRLTYTNMIHTRPLLGKAFLRRFRKHADLLEDYPAAQQKTGDWRVIGEPPRATSWIACGRWIRSFWRNSCSMFRSIS